MATSSNQSPPPAAPVVSTKPYFLRALYEWCTDNGFTPYITVAVDGSTRVPNEFVKDRQIVLNISFGATSSLKIGNDFLSFAARFGGVARDIVVPIERIAAIYARENSHGMAFEVTEVTQATQATQVTETQRDAKSGAKAGEALAAAAERPPRGGKPKLTVVK